jgi:phosphoserine phosphatase RsbU/P
MRKLKILLLEDNELDTELVTKTLTKDKLDYDLRVVDNRDVFMSLLYTYDPDVILSDHSLPNFTAIDALKIARQFKPDFPFILFTGAVSEEFAVECMKAGVDNYILKNSLVRLSSAIKNALSRTDVKREKEMVESLHNQLKVAYDEVKERSRHITDSINYAKLIQDAMLPDKKMLSSFFSESFIIYKPKDIVSGDFYWFTEVDSKLLLVIADCTGHGVPGALMSMIGYGLLNEIVNVHGVTQPAKILARLNFGVRRALKQNSRANRRCDGMDLAVCMIDPEEKSMEFAGANRHLVLFKDKELNLIKGDKYGVGGIYSETIVEFKNHKIEYELGDVFYLFTDGYADQFGGPRGQRMMTKNLFKILQRSLAFGLKEQEHVLLHWWQSWRKNLTQTDDVLLMGAQF